VIILPLAVALLKGSGWLGLESRLEPVFVAPVEAGTPTKVAHFNTAESSLSIETAGDDHHKYRGGRRSHHV
jgi:hypothetical protein